MFNGCDLITCLCRQWLVVGAAEAEVVEEEGAEGGEAHGDNRHSSLLLSPARCLYIFFCSVFFLLFFFGHLSPLTVLL